MKTAAARSCVEPRRVRRPARAPLRFTLIGLAALGMPAAMFAAAAAKPASATAAQQTASPASAANAASTVNAAATTAALGDLGLALLRDVPGANAVVSPVAVATVLGLIQSGANGATEHEIEALFGAGHAGTLALRRELPALSAQLRADAKTQGPTRLAARAWIDRSVGQEVPASYKHRVAQRHGADALVLSFAETEAARAEINRWTAEHTAGRVAELLPAGSLARSTQITLTSAMHFRAAWQQPFDATMTEARPFTTSATPTTAAAVPTLNGERAVAQALVEGTQLYALPFASGYDLLIALPAEGSGVDALLKSASGAGFARWAAALQPARCSFAMPKFNFAPKSGSIRSSLQNLGVKTAFTDQADLRPMPGRHAPGAHVDDVHHAAGIAVDEQGGEAVAAAAATVKPKTLAAPPPACAVDRAFAFVVLHRASGAPLFIGRVGDPARSE